MGREAAHPHPRRNRRARCRGTARRQRHRRALAPVQPVHAAPARARVAGPAPARSSSGGSMRHPRMIGSATPPERPRPPARAPGGPARGAHGRGGHVPFQARRRALQRRRSGRRHVLRPRRPHRDEHADCPMAPQRARHRDHRRYRGRAGRAGRRPAHRHRARDGANRRRLSPARHPRAEPRRRAERRVSPDASHGGRLRQTDRLVGELTTSQPIDSSPSRASVEPITAASSSARRGR